MIKFMDFRGVCLSAGWCLAMLVFLAGSGTFDFSRPDPAFGHHLERRIEDLQRLAIEADLILWHPCDRWDSPT